MVERGWSRYPSARRVPPGHAGCGTLVDRSCGDLLLDAPFGALRDTSVAPGMDTSNVDMVYICGRLPNTGRHVSPALARVRHVGRRRGGFGQGISSAQYCAFTETSGYLRRRSTTRP
jgi:hypothetical protein